MHMQVWLHVVALDNRFNHDFSLFILRLSIWNPLIPSMVSWVAKQNGPINYTFALSPFCFSLSSFSSWSTWSSLLAITITDHHQAPSLVVYQPSSYTPLMTKVSTLRFHQLAKTKLGLSGVAWHIIVGQLWALKLHGSNDGTWLWEMSWSHAIRNRIHAW